MKNKVLKIGVDFDGVVAYNPFRIIRAPIAYFKQNILGIRKLSFFVPKNWWQKLLWRLVHESSILPANGVGMLKEMATKYPIELYLITARFDCLKENTYKWIRRYGLEKIFKEVLINERCEQPHNFKERIIREKKLNYYVEDNWDIVSSVNGRSGTRIFWIYNMFESRREYKFKFPYLKKALEKIRSDEHLI